MEKSRTAKIIESLVSSDHAMTIDAIALKLGVSNRTIRNGLTQVEKAIKQYDLELCRKPGVGIYLEGTDSERLRCLKDVAEQVHQISPFSPEDRHNYILRQLFLAEEPVTTGKLASALYVSQVTIQKDLKAVQTWLSRFKLTLGRYERSKLEVQGLESDCRNAIAQLIAVNDGYEDLKNRLYEKRLDLPTKNRICELIDMDYDALEHIVSVGEAALGFKFSDEAFASLIIHLAIAIKRVRDGKEMAFVNEHFSYSRACPEYLVATRIAQAVSIEFEVQFPQEEIDYVFLHIIGTKLLKNPLEIENIDMTIRDEDQQAVVMAREIIKIAGDALMMDFSHDKHLLNGLILHLRPTINRLENGLSLRNPILSEIKENYPEVYGAAWMTNVIFEKHCGMKIDDAEIGFIAMHLGAAVERKRRPFRTLIVCGSGLGTAQLLAVRIENRFKRLEVVKIASVSQLECQDVESIDLILSTIPLHHVKPVLHVSPLLTQTDIRRIELLINTLEVPKIERSLFHEDLIEHQALYANREDAIRSLADKLFSGGYVRSDFTEHVLAREAVYTTEIGNGVAIPHSVPDDVLHTRIAVAILKKPILWQEAYVDVIF